MGIRAGRGRPKAAGMEYAEIIEAIGREAADLLLAEVSFDRQLSLVAI
jgi:hypothetical protein